MRGLNLEQLTVAILYTTKTSCTEYVLYSIKIRISDSCFLNTVVVIVEAKKFYLFLVSFPPESRALDRVGLFVRSVTYSPRDCPLSGISSGTVPFDLCTVPRSIKLDVNSVFKKIL